MRVIPNSHYIQTLNRVTLHSDSQSHIQSSDSLSLNTFRLEESHHIHITFRLTLESYHIHSLWVKITLRTHSHNLISFNLASESRYIRTNNPYLTNEIRTTVHCILYLTSQLNDNFTYSFHLIQSRFRITLYSNYQFTLTKRDQSNNTLHT